MNAKYLVGSMLVFGLALTNGVLPAFADSPVDFDPDAYVAPTSLEREIAAAPAFVPDWAVQYDPDGYTTSLQVASVATIAPTDVNADPDAYVAATSLEPEIAAAPAFVPDWAAQYDPDGYTTSLQVASVATIAPTDVNADPDAYVAATSLEPEIAAAPAFAPDWAAQYDPDGYTTSLQVASIATIVPTDVNADPDAYVAATSLEPEIAAAPAFVPDWAAQYDPDGYTSSLDMSVSAAVTPSDVNADPDAYTTPLSDGNLIESDALD